jgi:hypothetical protein
MGCGSKPPDEVPAAPSRTITPAGRDTELWNDELFSQLRKDAGVPDDFLNQGWSYDKLEKGGGKGGTLMAFLWGMYIVKELSDGDHKTLLEVTQSYVEHLRNGESRICTVLLHYIDLDSGRKFFAMRNEVGSGPFLALYDCKGCADDKTLELEGKPILAVHKRIWNLSMWCGRCGWSEARRTYYKGKEDASRLQLRVSREQRDTLVKQLARDVEWLTRNNLMDYSFLVAIRSEAPANPSAHTLRTARPNVWPDGEDVFLCLSIIDFLQKWTCGKRCARGLKVFECNKATIPPSMYGERFRMHFEDCFVVSDEATKLGKEAPGSNLNTVAPPAGSKECVAEQEATSSANDNFDTRRE